MDIFAFPPLAALLELASSGMTALTNLLTPLAGASAAAAAIVLVTLTVRALLLPFGVSQARAEQTRSRLAPKLHDLQRRHRKDPQKLQRATMDLYRAEGVSPFAGCLPLLAQAPILGLVYAAFLHPQIAGHANPLLHEALAGVPLGSGLFGALTAGSADLATVAVIGGIAALIAVVAELTRRFLRVPAPPRDAAPGMPAVPTGLLGALQFTTAGVALFVPLAAGLYLLSTVGWTLVQRIVLRRRYPLAE